MAFAHLHVHSRYSVLDGVAGIPDLFRRARKLGQPGLALTDHGALYGVPEFLLDSKHYPDIKPVVGCEIYLTDHYDHRIKDIRHRKVFHLTLLAKNLTGYRNLVKIVTTGNLEGEYYGKPRISHEVLSIHHEGLMALSGCIAGEIPRSILEDDMDKAETAIRWYKEVFGDDFYLEVMAHNWAKSGKGHNLREMQDKVNAAIFNLAWKYNVDVVATNDVHFVLKKDSVLQDEMFKEFLYKGEKYSPLYTGEEYLKSEKQMLALFPDHPEAISNTMKVLDKVERYSIESDLVRAVRGKGGLVASGYGDIASSLINYLLDTAELDPVQFGLAERFINNSERQYPDLELYFDKTGSQFVLPYLMEKYGRTHVAKVAFLVHPNYDEAEEITEKYKLVRVRKYAVDDSYNFARFDVMNLNYSERECKGSVLLSRKPMTEYVPLSLSSKDNEIVSAYDNEYTVGFAAFEFLTSDALDI